MAAVVSGKKNVKIFVLYLMENINYPLDFVTINDIIMQTDYVLYLDFAESFIEMQDDGLIVVSANDEDGSELYEVSPKGRFIAAELKSDILDEILDKSLTAAFRYLDFKRRGVTLKTNIEKQPDGGYIFSCELIENKKILFQSDLLVDSLNRAERMKQNFYERTEAIYRGINALFAGNVNFLFDQ